jgi:hypothetical protein
MPLLLLGDTSTVADGRTVQLAGLPDFNGPDLAFKITQFDGWFDGVEPDAVFVKNGGGAGAVASGPWVANEKAYVLGGRIFCESDQIGLFRRLLLAALPYNAEAAITVLGNGLDPDQQLFVRCTSKPTMTAGAGLYFTFTLTALDPFRYGLDPLIGSVGVYTGQTWYETYSQPSTTWVETYSGSGSAWWETFQQAIATGPYPDGLTLTSSGDAASRRGTVTVTGPLTLGDWWLLNEATGDRLWADLALDVGQAMTFDCQRELATIAGADITSLVGGDWLTLEPGGNLYRLVAGSQSNAFATFSTLEAYL